jgi:hypothetical protein
MSDNVNRQTRKETLEMRKRKPLALAGIGPTAITMLLLTPVFLLALAGCGSASKTSAPAHAIAATGTTCSKRSSDSIKECIVTLSDTRQVVCVVYAGYQRGGMSCDWSHVSGADKEPAR